MFGHTETKVIYGVPTIVKFISSNKKTTLYAISDINVILLKDKVYLCNAISHEELIDRYIYHKKLTVYKSICGYYVNCNGIRCYCTSLIPGWMKNFIDY